MNTSRHHPATVGSADQSFRRSTDAVVKRLVVAATDSREKSPPEGRDLLVAATS